MDKVQVATLALLDETLYVPHPDDDRSPDTETAMRNLEEMIERMAAGSEF